MRALPSLLLLTMLLSACAGSRGFADGAIQKRQHRPGWHVDLRWGKTAIASRATTAQDEVSAAAAPQWVAESDPSHEAATMAATSEALPSNTHPLAERLVPQRSPLQETFPAQARSHHPSTIATQEPDPERTEGPFDWLGVVALGLVVLGILAAFLTNSGYLVSALLVTGIVVAAVALRRIRSLERRGKGFALAALMLGLVAALITLMVVIRSGF